MNTLNAQVPPDLPPRAAMVYPGLADMYGYALGCFGDWVLLLGGMIKEKEAAPAGAAYPNLEIVLINLRTERASAFTSATLPGALGEQLAATGLAFHQRDNLLYLLGGYGYSDTEGRFLTFPYLTVLDLPATIAALERGESPVAALYQLCDERLALFDGILDHNGDEFFLLHGRYAYKLRPFEDDVRYFETDHRGELRTFRLEGDKNNLRLADFRTWHDLFDAEQYYQQLLPEKIRRQMEEVNRQPGQ